ncbi:hypothetical protein MUN88_16000 [Gracilibacillus caseinilyticus]|uniref:Uncharacterized protein n=1 Tax=Gracilibacillus caseinilyticus TaxID=2932256 RepID=A0ABY4EUK6_9BACI|nr:hypothetical protein [Gracilibacillus caseinilyticus]UOQ47547.1 hypothetical protein MUN88_16000 [Gracilibacillus caseinilyticus]
MNKDKDYETRLKEQLRSMPKIKDERTKEEIYRQIQLQMIEKEEAKQRKKRWFWIPAISAVTCALLVFIVFLSQDRLTQFEQSSSPSASDEAQIRFESQENSIESRDSEESGQMEEASEESDNTTEDSVLQYQLEILPKEKIKKLGLLTTPPQYVVPITISEQKIKEPFSFNKLGDEIDLAVNGLQDIGLKHMTFTKKEQIVVASVQHDFTIEPDTASQQLFDQLMNLIFQPFRVKQIQFDQTNDFIDQINMVDNTYILKGSGTVVYKQYRYNAQASGWLVATKVAQFDSIEKALNEMKKAEPQYHVKSTIPNDAEIKVKQAEDDTLELQIVSAKTGQNQKTVNMIEAIIATAYSFGFQTVQFDIGYEQVGKYDLTKPVQTDQQINVIYR